MNIFFNRFNIKQINTQLTLAILEIKKNTKKHVKNNKKKTIKIVKVQKNQFNKK